MVHLTHLQMSLKGIPSYYIFQHFFEIAKRTFITKENNLYSTL